MIQPNEPRSSSPIDKSLPSSIEAERGVLGSILVNPDVCDDVALVLRSEDFFDDGHRRLFGIMSEMHDAGKKIDITLLIERLKSHNLYEKIGGAAYLADLADAVPHAAHATYYASVVREKATFRNLIGVSTEIIRDAYEEGGDAREILARAESKIFSILDVRGGGQVKEIKDVLHEAMDRIDARLRGEHQNGGVESGFTDLDSLTGGLHNSELVVLAARPSMGKTAFALNIADHVAIQTKAPVLFVSLEMSALELTDRMLCSLAKVNGHQLRNGSIRPDDRRRLKETAGEIAEAPFYVDDAPSRTVTEIAAAARRIRRREKDRLGLIVIDYLQLIEPDNSKDPRQEQVAKITRRLKGLAREMDVPVLVLAQLNRQAEASRDNKPRLSHLRECVTGETLVQLADGRRVPIRELVGQTPEVWSIDGRGRLIAARSDLVWSVGRRPVFEVRLTSGRSIRATAEHRLRGASGWQTVAQLQPGDRVAVARHVPEPTGMMAWPDDRVGLLAQLIGDGSYLSGQPMRYTTMSEDNSAFVTRAATEQFGVTVVRYAGRRRWHQLLIRGNGNRWRPAGVNAWLREFGVFGQRSHQKRVPGEVFRLDNRQIALFLRHLWATDGCIGVRQPGQRGSQAVYYATNSPGLAGDVAALLLRLGIVSRTHQAQKSGYRPGFQVHVSGAAAQKRFLEIVGTFGPRVERGERLAARLASVEAETNVDTLPRPIFDRVRRTMRERRITHRGMCDLRGTSHGGGAHFRFAPSRSTVLDYATILDDESLRAEATSDLFWDRIKSIEPAGDEDVFDLTVPGPANWLADGIVTHNSGAIEQDADVVMFVHREEYYHRGEEANPYAGQAEIIIAKQRNGPIGDVELIFQKEFTRFADKAPDRFNDLGGGGF